MSETNNAKEVFLEYVKVIIVTLIVTFAFLQFVQISRVYGSSMENTFHEGNVVLVDKIFYKQKSPKRNDIVIVDYNNYGGQETYIIKRVIGVGGDHLDIKNGIVYINGKQIKEDYIKEEMIYQDISIDIPEGKIFVMGDNRNNSLDSRVLGCFDFKEDVVGRVFFTVPFF